MDPDSRWLLLQTTTNILQEAARYLIGNTPYAKQAKRKVERQERSAADPFHSAMYSRLSALASHFNEGHLELDINNGLLVESMISLLDTFEYLARSTLEPPIEHSVLNQYPGLSYLQELYEIDRNETKIPRPPAYRLSLYCPSKDNRDRLRRDTVSCLNALDSAQRKPPDFASILDKIDSCKIFALPASITRDAERMGNVLLRYWECECAVSHYCAKKAVLAFAASQRNEKEVASRYRLYFRHKLGSNGCWRGARLALINTVEEYIPMHALSERSRAKRKAVRIFTPEFPAHEASKIPTWLYWSSLCHLFGSKSDHEDVYANEIELKSTKSSIPPNFVSMISLDQALTDNASTLMSKLGRKDRVVIGVILTYAYLYLDGTRWWSTLDIASNCWFACSSGYPGFNPRLPFFDLGADGSTIEDTADGVPPIEACMNNQRPSLPALGKLLLEVWRGTRVRWDELRDCLAECMQDDTGAFWSCAIKACLYDPKLKLKGSLRVHGELQSTYLHKVVKSLQWLLEELCCMSVKDAFSEILSGSIVHSHAHPINEKQSPFHSKVAGKQWIEHCSYTRYRDDITDLSFRPQAAAANAWIQRVKEDVWTFIQPDQYSPDTVTGARIAVIDTGIALDRRTAYMYDSQIVECRSWLGDEASDDGEMQPITNVDGDNVGHGTHAVSTLLKIDPFCQVYIARVFNGREDYKDATMGRAVEERIVKAIRYATERWNVDVISLSFGFDEHVEAIDHELLKAASKAVIFAAASNQGGGDETSWPARHPNVISVYATDADGNKYSKNPSPRPDKDNFATLGMDIEGWWGPGKRNMKSGTSVSTPVLAGFATLTVAFMRTVKPRYLDLGRMSEFLYDKNLRRLRTSPGMASILRLMAIEKEGYKYVQPWSVLSARQGDATSIADRIMSALRAA